MILWWEVWKNYKFCPCSLVFGRKDPWISNFGNWHQWSLYYSSFARKDHLRTFGKLHAQSLKNPEITTMVLVVFLLNQAYTLLFKPKSKTLPNQPNTIPGPKPTPSQPTFNKKTKSNQKSNPSLSPFPSPPEPVTLQAPHHSQSFVLHPISQSHYHPTTLTIPYLTP